MDEDSLKEKQLEKECLDTNFCNIKNVDKDNFGFTFKFLFETFKDSKKKESDETSSTNMPQSVL